MPRKPGVDDEIIRTIASSTINGRSNKMVSTLSRPCIKCNNSGRPHQISCGSCDAYICDQCHWCQDHHHEIRLCDRCRTPLCRECDEMDICHECLISHCQHCTTMDECIACHEIFCLAEDCNREADSECAAYCSGADCDAVLCRECWFQCKRCGVVLCEPCSKSCGKCKVVVCHNDIKFLASCDNCELPYCLECIAQRQPCIRCGRPPGKRLQRIVQHRLKSTMAIRIGDKDKVTAFFGKLTKLAAEGHPSSSSKSQPSSTHPLSNTQTKDNRAAKSKNYSRNNSQPDDDAVPMFNSTDEKQQRIAHLEAEAAARAAELELYTRINEEEQKASLAQAKKKKRREKKLFKEAQEQLEFSGKEVTEVSQRSKQESASTSEEDKYVQPERNSVKLKTKATKPEKNVKVSTGTAGQESADVLAGMQKVESKKESKKKKKSKTSALPPPVLDPTNIKAEKPIQSSEKEKIISAAEKKVIVQNETNIRPKVPIQKDDVQLMQFLTRVVYQGFVPTTMEVRKYFAGRLEEEIVTDVFNTAGINNISAAVSACAEMLAITVPTPPKPAQSKPTLSQFRATVSPKSHQWAVTGDKKVKLAITNEAETVSTSLKPMPPISFSWADRSKTKVDKYWTEEPIKIAVALEEEEKSVGRSKSPPFELSKSPDMVAELERKLKAAVDADDEDEITKVLENLKGEAGLSSLRKVGKKALKALRLRQTLELEAEQDVPIKEHDSFKKTEEILVTSQSRVESLPPTVSFNHTASLLLPPQILKPVPIAPPSKQIFPDFPPISRIQVPLEAYMHGRNRTSPPLPLPSFIKISESHSSSYNNLFETIVHLDMRVVGWIIGKGGTRIRDIQTQSGARMWVDQHLEDGRPMPESMLRNLHIQGSESQVQHATNLVSELVESAPIYHHPRSTAASPSPPPDLTFLPTSLQSSLLGPLHRDVPAWRQTSQQHADPSPRFLQSRNLSSLNLEDFSVPARFKDVEDKFIFEIRRPDQQMAPQIIHDPPALAPVESSLGGLRHSNQASPLSSHDTSASLWRVHRIGENSDKDNLEGGTMPAELPGLAGLGLNLGQFCGSSFRPGVEQASSIGMLNLVAQRSLEDVVGNSISEDDPGIDDILESVNSVAWLD